MKTFCKAKFKKFHFPNNQLSQKDFENTLVVGGGIQISHQRGSPRGLEEQGNKGTKEKYRSKQHYSPLKDVPALR